MMTLRIRAEVFLFSEHRRITTPSRAATASALGWAHGRSALRRNFKSRCRRHGGRNLEVEVERTAVGNSVRIWGDRQTAGHGPPEGGAAVHRLGAGDRNRGDAVPARVTRIDRVGPRRRRKVGQYP